MTFLAEAIFSNHFAEQQFISAVSWIGTCILIGCIVIAVAIVAAQVTKKAGEQ